MAESILFADFFLFGLILALASVSITTLPAPMRAPDRRCDESLCG